MTCITLKNVPDSLYRRLCERARRERRSISQQVLRMVERGLGSEEVQDDSDPVRRQLAAWDKLAGQWKSSESSAGEIRQLRKSRTRGRKVQL